MITEEIEKILKRALEEAIARRNEFVTLEHLLLAMTEDTATAQILLQCSVDIGLLQKDLRSFLDEEVLALPPEEIVSPQYTVGVQVVLQLAAAQVQAAGKKMIDAGHLLVSFFREEESHAVYFLTKQGVTKLDIVKYISHRIPKNSSKGQSLIKTDGVEKDENGQDPLDKFCINLNLKARQRRIDPLIGREYEISRTVQILARRRKNNPIFVGDAGVGKTAIGEGLALMIERGEVPDCLKGFVVYSVDMAGLLAGTKFRGEFEERIKSVIDTAAARKNIIIFIDEIHNIIGAGQVSGGSLDASNLLKPALANGDIKCIGTTTYKEYRNIFEKDHALSRRFQKIEVKEPTELETIEILKGLKKAYEVFHQVSYSPATIKAAVELSAKYITDRFLPDKAIDIIDECGAIVKLRNKKGGVPSVTPKDIEALVSKVARVPVTTTKTDDREQLKGMRQNLQLLIYGQNEAVDKVVESIHLSRAGLTEPDKPVGAFLFSGPTGVGKTELAKQLAKSLGVEFIRFDMSEYMEKHAVSRLIGAPPGYVGFDQGGLLTEAITRNPHCVLLLDEIEKAHEDIYNILLQVMDHATLTDNNGRKADFRQVVLIMTTNTGARDSLINTIGFEKPQHEDKSDKAIEKAFTPEFRNRLTGIVKFNALDPVIIEQIVDKMVMELESRLKGKNVTVTLDKNARSYLAEKGFDHKFGARPIKRLIENEIAKPLSQEILFGKLFKGGHVTILKKKDGLSFKIIPLLPQPLPTKALMPMQKSKE